MNHDPVLDWLLSEENPSVRYFTLVDLLGQPPGDPQPLAARRAIAGSPAVRAIFAAQDPGGFWASDRDMYQPKYRSTLWQMLILAELGVDGAVDRVHAALRHIVPFLDEITDGLEHRDIHCLMGYTLFFFHRLGLGDHPVASRLAELTVAAYQTERWPCKYASRPDCSWGMVKVLRGLATVPPAARPAGAGRVIARAAEGLLEHRFWFEDPVADRPYVDNRDWLRFGFPLFYQSDLLEMLLALRLAGYAGHPRFAALAARVAGQRRPGGKWALGRGFNRHMHVALEHVGRPSRWITLRALTVLRATQETSAAPPARGTGGRAQGG